MRTIPFFFLLGLLAACQNSAPNPEPNRQDGLNNDTVIQNLPTPEPDSNSIINPAIWSAAEIYGREVCNCGQKFFLLYEEKEMSFNNNMSDAQKEKIEEKYEKKLNTLRDTFRECRAEALAKFEEISNYEQNLLTFRQGDSLKLVIMNAFDEAGCDKYELARAKIFSNKTQSGME
jgi:hypothetical protein